MEKEEMILRMTFVSTYLVMIFMTAVAQNKNDTVYALRPDRVFDGEEMHEGWQVLVKHNLIVAVGPVKDLPKGVTILLLKGTTILPGLIEGHSHLFLHPYNEVTWDEQVLNESRAERTARAVNHARATLMAGFTTVRDLGTEGAGYDDVGLKIAIEKGIVPGPRMLIATRAIVATGSYGPKSGVAEIDFPRGAAEAGGMEALSNEVRYQIGKGADLIKIYADYRWGLNKQAAPTFTQAELTHAVELTASGGRKVVVHASTEEAMHRAVMAGVSTIEHGDAGTPEIFALMKLKGVALCPTLSAGDAVEQYKGWNKSAGKEPIRIIEKRKSFAAALAAGVTICMGGDVGVYAHGDNAREMEMMVDYGMKPIDVLKSATSVNADVFGISREVGRLRPGLVADIIAVDGNPSVSISDVRKIRLIIKDGKRVMSYE
ncbi:metal-dependent hydrolase family protein [Flavitalea sp.]|nr:amidohydrolase family protein [Flavitalea sp.]